MTLAFVMVLDRGYLTVAFAVTALTTSIFAVVDRIALLRYVVVAIGIIVLGRLAWDPRIMGADVGTWPIFNWLLLGYGAPAVAFLGAGQILKREGEDLAVRLCDALGLLFAALLVFFQIRHALNGGDPLAPASPATSSRACSRSPASALRPSCPHGSGARPTPCSASRRWCSASSPRLSSRSASGSSRTRCSISDPVGGPVLLSTLLLAYLLPGARRRRARPHRPRRAARTGT